MSIYVDPLAAVDARAELADGVSIGPFCHVGPHVRIGAGTKLIGSVTLLGHVTLGEENVLHPGAVVGGEPQDISYRGSDTRVLIGDRNVLREGVTVNRASEKEQGLTQVGSDCLIMAGCHVAHDCLLGNHIIMANGTLLGGHVHIQDHVTLSGSIGVHHFCTLGSYSFVGGLSRVLHDVPPFMLCDGNPARPRCVNYVALERNGFTTEQVDALGEAYRLLYRARVGVSAAREMLRASSHLLPAVQELLGFLDQQTTGRHGRGRDLRRAA